MKLASKKAGRDGALIVVSNDLQWCSSAAHIAQTLQRALDDWDALSPRLERLAADLEAGIAPREPLDCSQLSSPLPRAYQWADGSAYVNHVALVRQARGAELPDSFWNDPLLYQGGSDGFLGPRDTICIRDQQWGYDLEGEVAVITGDVPMGADRATALASIKLVMIVNDLSLRGLIPQELAKGFGFFQSKPASAFSPCAVTPDALGAAWVDGKLHLPLLVERNGEPFGRANAGRDMTFDFGTLVAHAARTRSLCAGTIIGSGTVSNLDADGGPGRPIEQGGDGYSCIAEIRTIETIRDGAPKTPYLDAGDTIRIDMRDDAGRSIFGSIEQSVELG